jgi:hypothetical protein
VLSPLTSALDIRSTEVAALLVSASSVIYSEGSIDSHFRLLIN